ncbi:DUF3347 domain-containing protein [Aquimarina sp. W85]|uniref:DUF3347 domain-containing protein n=1 Tax=Aquimarina rhodophyticola TaxID=3342246 RepID=UPI00366FD962
MKNKTVKRTNYAYLIMLTLCIVSTLYISCGKDKKDQPVLSEQDTVKTSRVEGANYNQTDDKITVEFEDKLAASIYTHYLGVKAALVNSDINMAMSHAKKLSTILTEDVNYKQLKATAQLMALTKDIGKQRDFFSTLTDETIKILSKAKIASGEIFKQFCPMAFDGDGGYWLSDSKEIRNPYYGNKMLTCGSVQEVLK